MKTQITTEEKKTITYICEICGKTSPYRISIERCEKIHKCNHTPQASLKESDDDYSAFKRIEIRCADCGLAIKGFPQIDLEDLEENHDLLMKIYNLIREENDSLSG